MLAVAGSLWACSEPLPAAPPGRLDSAAAQARGRALFLEHCALCHGENADGHGVRQEGLSAPPRDFTSHIWKDQASPGETFRTIREGIRGSSMAAWPGLAEDETWDLVAYLHSAGKGP